MARCAHFANVFKGDGFFTMNIEIRGFHVYRDSWSPVIGQKVYITPESGNPNDCHAMAVTKNVQQGERALEMSISRVWTVVESPC